MPKTLKVLCDEVVTFNNGQIGVYQPPDNIGLEIPPSALISVSIEETLTDKLIAKFEVSNDYSPPAILEGWEMED